MDQYIVTGMSCAACSARVEKAVNAVEGVTQCSVNLLTNSMGVEGTAEPAAIIAAVEAAGYGASPKGAAAAAQTQGAGMAAEEEMLKDRETPVLKKRLIVSLGFLAVLMYFSMGHMMFGWPLPAFFEGNHVAMGILQMLLAGIVMIINQKFFRSGFSSLLHRAPNMDTLVAMGSGVSFAYSTVVLFLMTDAQLKGDGALVMQYMHGFYFESAAMIVTLITIGKMLEAMSKGRTTDALKSLMKLAPKTATVIRDGIETEIPADQIRIGDVFVVRPGETVPVDGVILEGSSALNEAALTGESLPVDKTAGDMVSAATVNQEGFLRCEATRVGQDTTLSQIIRMVSEASATKAPIAKIADKVSGVFVPCVLAAAAVTFVIWMLVGQTIGYSLARAISVLVISCPCALGLATPVAIMVGSGVGAKQGILFKTAVSLEAAGKVQIAALDKTGTITSGLPVVTDIMPADGMDETGLLRLAYALEAKSEHPLAKAVCSAAQERQLAADDIRDFKAVAGNGLHGILEGCQVYGGSMDYIGKQIDIPGHIKDKARQLADEGKTPLFFAKDGGLAGLIAVADTIKEDGREAVRELQQMGIHVVMLTGDNARTAQAIGRQAGVDEVIAGVLPDGKDQVIQRLKKQGSVAMVGDGINDAPALTRADVGIAIGAGADVAIDAADVVLMKSHLRDVPAAIRLSRATIRNIHQNLFWAFIYNLIGIPLAAGAYIHAFGWELNPMFGAAAMSLSSFCVVTNALRLNLVNIHDASKDKMIKKPATPAKEEKSMEKTMKIEGMMCPHCEATVKKALEAIDGVESAAVSHEQDQAVVTLSAAVADEVLKKAVEDKDYKVLAIQ